MEGELMMVTRFTIPGGHPATANVYKLDLKDLWDKQQLVEDDIVVEPYHKVELPVNGVANSHLVGADNFNSDIYMFACGHDYPMDVKHPSFYICLRPGNQERSAIWKVVERPSIGYPIVMANREKVYVLADYMGLYELPVPTVPFDWFTRFGIQKTDFSKLVFPASLDYPRGEFQRNRYVIGFAVFDDFLLISTRDTPHQRVHFFAFDTTNPSFSSEWKEVSRQDPKRFYPGLFCKSPVVDSVIYTYNKSDYLIAYEALRSAEDCLKPPSKIPIDGGTCLKRMDDWEHEYNFSLVHLQENDFYIVQLGSKRGHVRFQRVRITMVHVNTHEKNATVKRTMTFKLTLGYPAKVIDENALWMQLMHCFMSKPTIEDLTIEDIGSYSSEDKGSCSRTDIRASSGICQPKVKYLKRRTRRSKAKDAEEWHQYYLWS